MARFRYPYLFILLAVVMLLIPRAIRYAEHLRARRWYGEGPADRLGYYQNILKQDPGNVDAIKMLAGIYFDLRKFDESKEYYRRAAAADPNDPESYYSIAVIEWTQAFQLRSDTKAELTVSPSTHARDMKVCEDLKAKNGPGITEGMDMLLQVLELRPDYMNATFYMGLLWREKAYIECGDAAAIRYDLKHAEQWMNRKKFVPSYDDSRSARLYAASGVPGAFSSVFAVAADSSDSSGHPLRNTYSSHAPAACEVNTATSTRVV